MAAANPFDQFDEQSANPFDQFDAVAAPAVAAEVAKEKTGGPLEYAKETVSNIPGSAWKLTKNLASMVLHPIDTATGLKNIVQGAGETAARDLLQLLPGYKAPDYSQQEQAFLTTVNPLTQSIMEPSGIPGRVKEFVKEDPVMALFNASLGVGGLGKTAEAAGMARTASTLGKVAEYSNPVLQGAKAAVKTTKAAGKGFKKVVKESLGAYTGRGPGFVEEMVKGSESAERAMRGEITGEEVVSHAKDGLQKLRDMRGEEYRPKLEAIRANPDELNAVRTNLDQTVSRLSKPDEFDLGLSMDKNGKLQVDFSNSTIVEHQGAVKRALEDVTSWQDNTAAGLDTLKKRLSTYEDQAARQTPAKALLTQLRKNVSDGLKKAVPEYEEMTAGYRDATRLIDDIDKSLSIGRAELGGRATADQTLRRLSSAFREGFEMRKDLLRALGNESGMEIPAEVAGYLAQQVLPAGMIGKGLATANAYLGMINPKMWPILAASSPRVVGEFLNAYGKAARSIKTGTDKVTGLAERGKTAVLGSGKNPSVLEPEIMPGTYDFTPAPDIKPNIQPSIPAPTPLQALTEKTGLTKQSLKQRDLLLSEIKNWEYYLKKREAFRGTPEYELQTQRLNDLRKQLESFDNTH